ncbi:MAG: hypothetical protein ACR2JC_14245 [Chloroflexota bacterium]
MTPRTIRYYEIIGLLPPGDSVGSDGPPPLHGRDAGAPAQNRPAQEAWDADLDPLMGSRSVLF